MMSCNFCRNDRILGVNQFHKRHQKSLEDILQENTSSKHKLKQKEYNLLVLEKFLEESEVGKIYNLGSGTKTTKCEDAADLLLKRNYPEINNGSQTSTIFIPETFLREIAGCVDLQLYLEKLDKGNLNDDDIWRFNNVLGKQKGDFTERKFFDEFKKVLRDKKVVVFHSPRLLTPESKANQQESDFIIINQDQKYIMCLETKFHLFSQCEGNVKKTSIEKGIDQLAKTKHLLETYFFHDIEAEQ